MVFVTQASAGGQQRWGGTHVGTGFARGAGEPLQLRARHARTRIARGEQQQDRAELRSPAGGARCGRRARGSTRIREFTCAVAVVHIEVHDCHALHPSVAVHVHGVSSTHGSVVEEAEAVAAGQGARVGRAEGVCMRVAATQQSQPPQQRRRR